MGNSASSDTTSGARFLAGCPPIPPPPSDHDVKSEFENLLRARHVSPVVIKELSCVESIETKWMYSCLDKYLATPEGANKELLERSVCVQEILDPQLHLESLHDLFRAVRINMILRPMEWTEKFIGAGGVQALVVLLDPTKAVSQLVHVEALNALFALSNAGLGMEVMAQADGFCDRLVGLYTSSLSSFLRSRILKLLGMVCSANQTGQNAVVAAINRGSGDDAKFAVLSKSFMEDAEDRAFQLSLLSFVNVVISTRLTAIERVAIRDDLEKNGFVSTLERYQLEGDPAMAEQVQLFLKGRSSDREKPSGGVQRRLSLSIPSAGEELVEATVPAPMVTEERSIDFEKVQPIPQPEGPRSLQARKSLRLEMAELHTETEEVHGGTVVSPPPPPDPMQRRPSGSLLPSLSIPKVTVAFGSTKSIESVEKPPQSTVEVCLPAAQVQSPVADPSTEAKAPPSLENIMSMLQQGTKSLDEQTNQKLLNLLATLATSITTEGTACGKVVAKLEQSLTGPLSSDRRRSPDASPVLLPRLQLRLPSRYSDSDVYALATGTPAKASVGGHHHHSRTHGDAHSEHPPRSPSLSHYEEEHSPRRSMTETESYDESSHEHETQARNKTSVAKNALAGFFQHLKKGQALPTTPAPTPMATASVKKDARRPVFPSFGTASAAPSPMPDGPAGSFALPPLTPLKPSISASLPPLTPIRPQVVPTMSTPIAMIKSPRMNDQHLEAVKEEEAEPPSPAVASSSSTLPDISKFRKLLAMGAPKAAVRAKMQQAGVDPDLLERPDAVPKAEPQALIVAPVAQGAAPAPEPTPSGPDISKFRKLLTMGAPLAAVKAKMQQAGLDPALLDQPPSAAAVSTPTPPASQPPAPTPEEPAPAQAASTKIKDDPAYAKFFKLRSMGAPAEAVKAKIRQAGLNPDFLDTPDADMPSTSNNNPAAPIPAPAVEPALRVRDDPDYAKFFKLLSMGAPPAAVKAKMQQAGVNPDLLDTPDALVPPKAASNNNNAEHSAPASEPAKKILVKDHSDYAKFFKLKTMTPVEVVKAKMRQAGLDPELLDTPDAEMPTKNGPESPETPAPSKLGGARAALASMLTNRQNPPGDTSSNQSSQATVLVKDDPAYAKFFKLVAMGAPPDTVKGKMQMAGLRPELLDTPDAPLNPGGGSNNQASNNAAAAPAAPARRANLALSIKPPTSVAKPTTRPLYWQQLKGDSIRGTIWEEIDKEQTKENNAEVPLFLGDSELGLLEKEFPAQTAPMTGPGKQTRSLSMDQMPKELMSPRVVFLIDRSRANNISIIIKQFRMSHAAIREATMKVDANVLTLERVQGLIKILPTDEEVAAITNYQGDPLALNEAERVLKELITVPRLKQRLTAMQSKLQFPQFVRDLQQKVDKLRAACTEVGQSSEFKTVLQVVLQVGNKMNQGTARGGAKGFRLGDLPKLSQLKAIDKTSTLLHYVARMIRLKKGNAVRLSESLSSLYDVQNIPIPELPADMSKVSEIVEYVTNELGAQKLKNAIEEKEPCDHFVKIMGEFLATASSITNTLKKDLETMVHLLKETMQRFGFQGDSDSDESTPTATDAGAGSNTAALASAGEFFTLIYEFSVALMKADRENEVKRLREEAKARQSAKAKTPALGQRSMSSRDMTTASRRTSVAVEKKADGSSTAGPETPEPSKAKDKASAPGERVSPMLRQRSASLSAIVANNIDVDTIVNSLPAKSSSPSDTAKAPSVEKKSTAELKTPSKKADTPETKPSAIKPPTKIVLPSSSGAGSNDKDKGSKPKSAIPMPTKIVKTPSVASKPSPKAPGEPTPQKHDYSVCYESPLGLTMPEALDKPKPKQEKPEFEEALPFDMASIEAIRAQLVKKHVPGDGNNSSEVSTTKSSSPEQSAAEIELYTEAFEDDA